MSSATRSAGKRSRRLGSPDWHAWFDDIVSLYGAVASFADPEAIYGLVAEKLCSILECDGSSIFVINAMGDSFMSKVTYQAGKGFVDFEHSLEPKNVTSETGRMRTLLESHCPIIQDTENPNPADIADDYLRSVGYRTSVSIPIVTNDKVQGMVSFLYKEMPDLSEDYLEYLLLIGQCLGMLFSQANRTKSTVELKILAERKQLGEEIHDNLSQLVSLIGIVTDSTILSYKEGDGPKTLDGLEELKSIGQEAFKILRDEILYLRAPVNQENGLVASLEEVLKNFQEIWAVPVSFKRGERIEGVAVSIETVLQLSRILHEALVNIVRHAKANTVEVRLDSDESELFLQIADDGCGFDVDSVPTSSMGIAIMKERANQVGGAVQIESEIEHGTIVNVRMPLLL